MNRREFGRKCFGLTAVALTASGFVAHAEDVPKLDPESGQAKALGYVEDASTVDAAAAGNFVGGSTCSNCVLYQGGDKWGPCGIFPGKHVAAKGWCKSYLKKG